MPRVLESDVFRKNANILAAFSVFCLMQIAEKLFLLIFSKININLCESCPVTDNKRTIPQSKWYSFAWRLGWILRYTTKNIGYFRSKFQNWNSSYTFNSLYALMHICSKNQSYFLSYSSCWPISSCFVWNPHVKGDNYLNKFELYQMYWPRHFEGAAALLSCITFKTMIPYWYILEAAYLGMFWLFLWALLGSLYIYRYYILPE